MCWCTPSIRTPNCGKASCMPQRTEGSKQADPDIRRLHETRCDTGTYLILKNDQVEERAVDFVSAEIKAHSLARRHPTHRIVVAKGVLEVKGVPHVYEVHPKT